MFVRILNPTHQGSQPSDPTRQEALGTFCGADRLRQLIGAR